MPTHAIKSRVGKLNTRVGKFKKFFGASRRIFSKNLCPPWPETVPAPLGQTAGWMKTPLGTEVDIIPAHIVLDGVPAVRERRTTAPLFSAMSIVATVAHLSYC